MNSSHIPFSSCKNGALPEPEPSRFVLDNDNLLVHIDQPFLRELAVIFIQGPYSPIIPSNVLSPILQIFLYIHLEAFKCNTISDWLNNAV